MIKIQNRFLTLASAFLLLSSTAISQPLLWPAGENICVGGWQYEQLQSCELPGSIVDGEVASGTCIDLVEDYRTYKPCRAKVTDDNLGCGPEMYSNCARMSCPGSVWGKSYSVKRPSGTCDLDHIYCNDSGDEITGCYKLAGNAVVQCQESDKPATCRDPSCPVETWKLCKHSSCPVDKIYKKCNRWSSGYSDSCGGISQKITAPGALKPASLATDGRRAKDNYGLGSACLTCDDIPLNSPANIQKRFECLAKGIDLAEEQTPGYSFKTTLQILEQLKGFANSYSNYLNPVQTKRLMEILSQYSIEHQSLLDD